MGSDFLCSAYRDHKCATLSRQVQRHCSLVSSRRNSVRFSWWFPEQKLHTVVQLYCGHLNSEINNCGNAYLLLELVESFVSRSAYNVMDF